ncbi:hypothetical protein GCM10023170_063140 [Phytohabitans houttuyneae]|uniref:Uncharacterized protein n=1 Tax=Phytohabitans houttuyneae TaxID=1076126 RepID=A0A6V8K8J4_9ACTN|nr:hypothetical protein Phou_042740 [Phytohabitans houttuyneae]
MAQAYDRDKAEASMGRLAATTDAELRAGIADAMREVAAAARAWTSSAGRSLVARERGLAALVEEVEARMAAQPAGEGGAAVLAAIETVQPLLGEWWPDRPQEAARLHAAVEQLRRAAMHTPTLVAHCRRFSRS